MKTFYYGNRDADTILVQMVDDHDLSGMDSEVSQIEKLTNGADFLLCAVKADDWNADLSPWPAPPVWGEESFGSGAIDTLEFLSEDLLPELLRKRDSQTGNSQSKPDRKEVYAGKKAEIYIGGYSMAGFFALWAAYQTDLFRGAAAVSPSVWFPHFREYVHEHEIQTDAVYLSLGTKEEKTRNQTMAEVGNAVRDIYEHLQETNVPCTLEWNPGNHFREPDLRTAKGFAWLLNQRKNRKE